MSVREKTIQYINTVLKSKPKSKTIENSIYNYCVQHFQDTNYTKFNIANDDHEQYYILKSKSIIYNVELLLDKIKKNNLNFKLSEIAFKNKFELYPEKWEKQIKKSEMNKKRLNDKPQATTDQFQCSKCKQNKTTYYLLQTRGMDEPETAFITCVNCGNQWRQNG